MPKAKSSVKDIIINVVLLAVTAGVLVWKYDSCKKKEAEAQKAAEQHRDDALKAKQKRIDGCLASVPEASRNECMTCSCQNCTEQFENCANDKECRTMTVEAAMAASSSQPANLSRTRYEERASCMYNKCGDQCGRKP